MSYAEANAVRPERRPIGMALQDAQGALTRLESLCNLLNDKLNGSQPSVPSAEKDVPFMTVVELADIVAVRSDNLCARLDKLIAQI